MGGTVQRLRDSRGGPQRAWEGPGYLEHNDEGQADGQEVPVGAGILPIVFPERPIPAGNVGLGVGSRAVAPRCRHLFRPDLVTLGPEREILPGRFL